MSKADRTESMAQEQGHDSAEAIACQARVVVRSHDHRALPCRPPHAGGELLQITIAIIYLQPLHVVPMQDSFTLAS